MELSVSNVDLSGSYMQTYRIYGLDAQTLQGKANKSSDLCRVGIGTWNK
jgi:hypothetical protein